MKKFTFSIFTLFLVFAFTFSVSAQVNYKLHENTYQKVSATFTFGDVKATDVKTDAGYFSRLTLGNCHNSAEIGNPELPLSINMLEIPLCEDFVLNVTGKDFVIYNAKALGINFPIYPAQPSYSKSSEGPYEIIQNKTTYLRDEFYSLPLATFEVNGIMRNVNLGTLYVSPVQYNPITNEIKVYKTIDVEILFKNANVVKTQALKELHYSPMFKTATVINPFSNAKTELNTVPIKYLIVANAMFRGQLDEFIAWKKRKGFIVEIGYTDESNVGTTTTSITTFIKSHYDNATATNPAPSFVQLVGDVAQMPSYSSTLLASHPSDLYYVTWQGGNIPSCHIGRFSATNAAQLQSQIDKTLQYEQFTMPDPNYLNDAVLIAGTDASWAPTHGNGFVNYASQNYVNAANGFGTVYAHLHPCSSQAAIIRAEIGAGVGLANYTAHCSPSGWAEPSFVTSHVPAMSNLNKYGLMIGNCCQSSKFDQSECFGEAVLRAVGKGAVGYLGGTESTYWNEDYYWGIGLRSSCTANPTYSPTQLGSYDRMFHTHGETQDKWISTFAGINLAGNEAVQSSSSGADMKKYYWEIYCVLGDPSIMTYITKPTAMTVNIPEIMMVGANSLDATVAPYAYCALTKEGALLAAGFADVSGNITLTFDSIGDPGEYEFAAWAQNKIQFFKTIQCIVPQGSYVTGNVALNSGTVAYNGGLIDFDVTLKNIGVDAASNIEIKLETASALITLVNNTTTVASIAAGGEVNLTELFESKIHAYILNNTEIEFVLTAVSDNNTFVKALKVKVGAPKLAVTNIAISKIAGGEIEAGDEVEIEIELSNTGENTVFDVISNLSSYFSGFEITNSKFEIEQIDAGGKVLVTFGGKVGNEVTVGSVIPLYFQAFKGTYDVSAIAQVVVGSIMEDFESGNFLKFAWINDASNPWEITTSNVYQGTFSARSKTSLAHGGVSQLKFQSYVPAETNVSYARRVSSESNYDWFNFLIDGEQKEHISGNGAWGTSTFPVTAGNHTFTFEYTKDVSDVSNLDCAFIDNVSIPGMGITVVEDLPKLIVKDHTVDAEFIEGHIIPVETGAELTFQIINTGTVDATNAVSKLTSNSPIVITAENSTNNESLPFDLTSLNEKSLKFRLDVAKSSTPFVIAEFLLEVTCANSIAFYPLVLDFAGNIGICDNYSEMKCTISPNPASKFVNVSTENNIKTIEIIDANGRSVSMLNNINNNNKRISIADLASGFYFVKVIDQNAKVAVKKMIKQ